MSEFAQSVVVTLVAAAALAVLVRPLFPRRRAPAAKPGCPSCGSGPGCE